MANLSYYSSNKLVDAFRRGFNITAPADLHMAAIYATKGYSSSVRSTHVNVNDTVIPTTPNGHMYRCTTAGTCGSGEPTFPTSVGGTVTDGGAVWTEMTPDFRAGTNLNEVADSGYSRYHLTCNGANFTNTQNSGTGASNGTSMTTTSEVAFTFGTMNADVGIVAAVVAYDASSGGNIWDWAVLTVPKNLVAGASLSVPSGSESLNFF